MELYKHEKENGASIPSDTILQLFEDSKKRVWIGTSNGVALYNSELKSFRSFRHTKQASSLSNNKIGTITEDADGYIWVGTENGINKYQENSGTFKRYFYSDKNPNNCLFIKSDRKGRLWLSIYDKGVFILDKKSGLVVKHFNTNKNNLGSLTSQRITTFFEASDGTVWLGDTGNHIDKETEKFGLYHLNAAETIFTQYLPNKNDPNAISSDQINFLAEDSSKRLWIGFDEGMNLYDAKTNRFKMYDDGHLVAFAGSVKDKSGNIWFTSYGGKGLISIDVDSSKISAYGDEQGLLNNDINEVALDDSGMIWIPNQRGLSVFNPNSKKFIKNYFEKDGFQPYSYDYIVLKSSNGDIWIGGSKGLNKIVPSQLLNKDPIPPSVVITQITINGISYSKPDGTLFKQSVPYTTEIELSSNQKDLNFNFVALHYLRAEDNLYSWKLQNYDKDWSEPSNIRTASYTNLSPGTYVFRIMASNADGVWTAKDTSIKITILPPWWKSWWSYLLYAIIFTAALSFFIAYRAAALKKQNKILEEKVELRTTQLQTSLTNLKDTQSQLIQSEKMASLGELTAGIAHEIQNPLNFVNNFSEVSSELLDEMNLEIEKGDFDEAKAIAIDLKQNLEKINHHGKRADGIVKGMLQHSRRTSGVKQLTDLNALCDEYLRLSYHGLRAKDKSFNAIMKTDFDTTIGKINIIPQDFGRVVLNLLTNAFYAADEKKKSGIENYEPTISISTKTIDDKLEIKISDNGGGIPANAIDKIFQPFFTTKPTGQGTGLGLSLSYDIVKAHGGELKVETKEKIGTDFIIILPITT
jgi:signal transduction histidine kinase/streptogramin lyase